MKHKHCEVMKAYADGAKVQTKHYHGDEWIDVDAPIFLTTKEYRVKPIDTTTTFRLEHKAETPIPLRFDNTSMVPHNIKITFDAETGLPKKAEVIGSEV